MKKVTALTLSLILTISNLLSVYANVPQDYLVFSTPIDNTYAGRQEAMATINNLSFIDINNHWAQESIVHGVSLGVIQGGGQNFNPGAAVSNQEALGFAVRIMGLQSEAQAAAIELQQSLIEENPNIGNIRGVGYMEVARQNDLITETEFERLVGIYVDENLNQQPSIANNPATRAQVAVWTARALVVAESERINVDNHPNAILSFGDWQTIPVTATPYVEALTAVGIMQGDTNGNFNPNGSVTRAEMAQMLRNMDSIYYDVADLERKTGTVAAFRDNQEVATLQGDVWRNYYIRTSTGGVDVLQHRIIQRPSGQTVNTNAVVFKNGQVGGFELLAVGDQIEYIVRPEDNVVLYINVINSQQTANTVQGRLQSVDIEAGTITIRDNNDRTFMYNMVSGMYGRNHIGEYIIMDKMQTQRASFPIGSIVELSLINNIVTEVSFVGQPVHTPEIRGIVIENNPEFGFLTVIDNNGNVVTKQYHSNNMRVQREDYYQTNSNIGYISQMFPNFHFNPLDAVIADIVPGDIVFMRFDPNDPNVIVSISAAANYTVRHGVVRQVTTNNGRTQILVQFDNNQTSWFELPQHVFVSNQGRPVPHSEIQVGDRVRLLVNQAIIGPGHIMESVLEVSIQGQGHHISTIMVGNLAGFNTVQNQMMLHNARVLSPVGWGSHTQIKEVNTSARDIEFYHGNQRISLEHANRFLSRSNATVYVALDSSPAGERVRKVTFRDGRDEILSPATVINSDGNGNFEIASVNGTISTDNGTIVRRNGRMVTGSDINTGDLVIVALNGGNHAAVVDIIEAPAASGVNIARGRVASVNDGVSFTVQSMSNLSGNDWIFTPIEREFTIGPNTLFLGPSGFVDPNRFVGDGPNSVVNNVYTIVYDGSMATHVIQAPHANRSVRGTVHSVSSGGTIEIRNSQHLNNTTGVWSDISRRDTRMYINTMPNTIIVRNNNIVQPRDLQVGDQIRVLTTELPDMESGVAVPGYIILVEG